MLLLSALLIFQPPADRFAKWEKEIVAIEAKLKDVKPGGVTFVGSSTIKRWDLKKSFPGEPYFNAGFGGSVTADATHFVPRIVLPQKPAVVVFYSGDNDIAQKRTAEQVRDDARAFVKAVHDGLPHARIVVIGVKPSVARWAQYETQKSANEMVKADCARNPLLTFIDPTPMIVIADGKPKPDLFVKDGLHLSDAGYEPLAKAVAAAIKGK
jgi:lysophospholipase L1-like esterase